MKVIDKEIEINRIKSLPNMDTLQDGGEAIENTEKLLRPRRGTDEVSYKEIDSDVENENPHCSDGEQVKRKRSRKTSNINSTNYDSDDSTATEKRKRHSKSSAALTDDEQDDEEGFSDDEKDGTSGQILRVFVQDFMCHKKFDIKFGRHVNFVTGLNGSG